MRMQKMLGVGKEALRAPSHSRYITEPVLATRMALLSSAATALLMQVNCDLRHVPRAVATVWLVLRSLVLLRSGSALMLSLPNDGTMVKMLHDTSLKRLVRALEVIGAYEAAAVLSASVTLTLMWYSTNVEAARLQIYNSLDEFVVKRQACVEQVEQLLDAYVRANGVAIFGPATGKKVGKTRVLDLETVEKNAEGNGRPARRIAQVG